MNEITTAENRHFIPEIDAGTDDAVASMDAGLSHDLEQTGATTVNENRPVDQCAEHTPRCLIASGSICPCAGADSPDGSSRLPCAPQGRSCVCI
jgi:inosine-uridine nucleoside N-ribohydrolase